MQNDRLYRQAIDRFAGLFAQAGKLAIPEPTAMSLATADDRGWPSVRTVLLKSVDLHGFVFYTNTLSRKGRQLQQTRRAALCFYWQALSQQVLVEGRVESVTNQEADAYWATRARISQIGAWASLQSESLSSREQLEQRFAEYETRFQDQSVPRPPHWTGYRVVPDMIEFWQARPGRLHERERYFEEGGEWRHSLIYP